MDQQTKTDPHGQRTHIKNMAANKHIISKSKEHGQKTNIKNMATWTKNAHKEQT